MKIIHLTVKEPRFCGSFSFLSWEQRKLGELPEKTFGGGTPSTMNLEYWNGNIPWLQSSDITEGNLFDVKPKKFISQSGLNCSATQLVPANSIAIITRVGVGKLAFLPFSYTTSQDFLSMSKIKTEPYFTVYACYKKLQSELNSVQGTSIKGITKDELLAKEINLPSYKEQQQIGKYFTNLDNLITLHQREQFCGFLRFLAIKITNFLPISWEQRKLGDIGTTYTGLSGKSKEDFGHGYAKFVTYMNVFSNPVSSPTMIESVEIDDNQNCVLQGDVLFTTSSETPEEVGMSSVWLENMQNTYLNSFCFGYRPTTKLNPYYLAYMLRSSSIRKKIVFLAQGISRYNISKNKMMEIKIHIPELKEQELIGECFRNLDSLITLHQRIKIKITGE